jgi:hypothetical protein
MREISMQVFTAFFQAICILLGSADKAAFNDCLKIHTQQECQQIWRDK